MEKRELYKRKETIYNILKNRAKILCVGNETCETCKMYQKSLEKGKPLNPTDCLTNIAVDLIFDISNSKGE